MTKSSNVESFSLDHTKVAAPYLRLCSTIHGEKDTVYKFDVRFVQPNEAHLKMAAIHSLEHLLAENLRRHLDGVIDLSPMGCQTGFYLTTLNQGDLPTIRAAFAKTLHDVLAAEKIPAQNPIQCGWAANHNLEGAKDAARAMLAQEAEWATVFRPEPA